MNIQYLSNSKGLTAGVFIPIDDWDKLQIKYQELKQEDIYIPESHKAEVMRRLAEHEADPSSAMDFDEAMAEINKEI